MIGPFKVPEFLALNHMGYAKKIHLKDPDSKKCMDSFEQALKKYGAVKHGIDEDILSKTNFFELRLLGAIDSIMARTKKDYIEIESVSDLFKKIGLPKRNKNEFEHQELYRKAWNTLGQDRKIVFSWKIPETKQEIRQSISTKLVSTIQTQYKDPTKVRTLQFKVFLPLKNHIISNAKSWLNHEWFYRLECYFNQHKPFLHTASVNLMLWIRRQRKQGNKQMVRADLKDQSKDKFYSCWLHTIKLETFLDKIMGISMKHYKNKRSVVSKRLNHLFRAFKQADIITSLELDNSNPKIPKVRIYLPDNKWFKGSGDWGEKRLQRRMSQVLNNKPDTNQINLKSISTIKKVNRGFRGTAAGGIQ